MMNESRPSYSLSVAPRPSNGVTIRMTQGGNENMGPRMTEYFGGAIKPGNNQLFNDLLNRKVDNRGQKVYKQSVIIDCNAILQNVSRLSSEKPEAALKYCKDIRGRITELVNEVLQAYHNTQQKLFSVNETRQRLLSQSTSVIDLLRKQEGPLKAMIDGVVNYQDQSNEAMTLEKLDEELSQYNLQIGEMSLTRSEMRMLICDVMMEIQSTLALRRDEEAKVIIEKLSMDISKKSDRELYELVRILMKEMLSLVEDGDYEIKKVLNLREAQFKGEQNLAPRVSELRKSAIRDSKYLPTALHFDTYKEQIDVLILDFCDRADGKIQASKKCVSKLMRILSLFADPRSNLDPHETVNEFKSVLQETIDSFSVHDRRFYIEFTFSLAAICDQMVIYFNVLQVKIDKVTIRFKEYSATVHNIKRVLKEKEQLVKALDETVEDFMRRSRIAFESFFKVYFASTSYEKWPTPREEEERKHFFKETENIRSQLRCTLIDLDEKFARIRDQLRAGVNLKSLFKEPCQELILAFREHKTNLVALDEVIHTRFLEEKIIRFKKMEVNIFAERKKLKTYLSEEIVPYDITSQQIKEDAKQLRKLQLMGKELTQLLVRKEENFVFHAIFSKWVDHTTGFCEGFQDTLAKFSKVFNSTVQKFREKIDPEKLNENIRVYKEFTKMTKATIDRIPPVLKPGESTENNERELTKCESTMRQLQNNEDFKNFCSLTFNDPTFRRLQQKSKDKLNGSYEAMILDYKEIIAAFGVLSISKLGELFSEFRPGGFAFNGTIKDNIFDNMRQRESNIAKIVREVESRKYKESHKLKIKGLARRLLETWGCVKKSLDHLIGFDKMKNSVIMNLNEKDFEGNSKTEIEQLTSVEFCQKDNAEIRIVHSAIWEGLMEEHKGSYLKFFETAVEKYLQGISSIKVEHISGNQLTEIEKTFHKFLGLLNEDNQENLEETKKLAWILSKLAKQTASEVEERVPELREMMGQERIRVFVMFKKVYILALKSEYSLFIMTMEKVSGFLHAASRSLGEFMEIIGNEESHEGSKKELLVEIGERQGANEIRRGTVEEKKRIPRLIVQLDSALFEK